MKYPLAYHGDSVQIQPSVIKAIRRKLHLDAAHDVTDERFYNPKLRRE